MDDLVSHEFVEFTRSLSVCRRLSFLRFNFSRGANDLFFIHGVFNSLLVFVSDLLRYPLLRVKHEPVDALRHLLLDSELFLPPLHR